MGKKSPVWDHFREEKVNKVKQISCLICNSKISTGSNTTNLFTHLKTRHFTVYKSICQRASNKKDGDVCSTNQPEPSTSGASAGMQGQKGKQKGSTTNGEFFIFLNLSPYNINLIFVNVDLRRIRPRQL